MNALLVWVSIKDVFAMISAERFSKNDDQVEVAGRVRLTFRQLPNRLFHHLDVQTDGDRLILSGTLPSYYLKQLAQTIATTVDGVYRLDNQVEVIKPADSSVRPLSQTA